MPGNPDYQFYDNKLGVTADELEQLAEIGLLALVEREEVVPVERDVLRMLVQPPRRVELRRDRAAELGPVHLRGQTVVHNAGAVDDAL